MIRHRTTVPALGLLVAACAGGPEVTPQLVEARAAYGAASADPAIAAAAPVELGEAAALLRRAEQADSDAEMSHRAYLARQHVAIAQERAALEQARAMIAAADTARAQALLESRSRQASQAQAQARFAEEQAELAESRARALERQIQELQAKRTERGILVTLGDVLFATGRADLTPGAEVRIARVAAFLQRYPDQIVRVEGYTDATGRSGTNLRLSEQRAEAVRDALVRQGIDPDRIQALGFGAARPVADNATPAGRQANRRVELVISDPDGGLALQR